MKMKNGNEDEQKMNSEQWKNDENEKITNENEK